MSTSHGFRSRVTFRNDLEKLAFMQAGAARDARNPYVQRIAVQLVKAFRPDDWRGMATEIHRYVRDGIRYTHDPDRKELLMSAVDTLRRGADDCDGKARVAVALARAAGLEAVVWPKWKGPVLAHVQWGVKWPGSERDPRAQAPAVRLQLPGRREWIVGELTIKGAELGDDPSRIPVNPETGKLPLA